MSDIPWKRSTWTDMLSNLVGERYDATGAGFVSGKGMFAVPNGNQITEEPLGKIGGASFIPSIEDGTKADLIAFVRSDTDKKASDPKYMGTFSINGDAIKATKDLLDRVGVGASMLLTRK